MRFIGRAYSFRRNEFSHFQNDRRRPPFPGGHRPSPLPYLYIEVCIYLYIHVRKSSARQRPRRRAPSAFCRGHSTLAGASDAPGTESLPGVCSFLTRGGPSPRTCSRAFSPPAWGPGRCNQADPLDTAVSVNGIRAMLHLMSPADWLPTRLNWKTLSLSGSDLARRVPLHRTMVGASDQSITGRRQQVREQWRKSRCTE